jgi:hypothetical protein
VISLAMLPCRKWRNGVRVLETLRTSKTSTRLNVSGLTPTVVAI